MENIDFDRFYWDKKYRKLIVKKRFEQIYRKQQQGWKNYKIS